MRVLYLILLFTCGSFATSMLHQIMGMKEAMKRHFSGGGGGGANGHGFSGGAGGPTFGVRNGWYPGYPGRHGSYGAPVAGENSQMVHIQNTQNNNYQASSENDDFVDLPDYQPFGSTTAYTHHGHAGNYHRQPGAAAAASAWNHGGGGQVSASSWASG